MKDQMLKFLREVSKNDVINLVKSIKIKDTDDEGGVGGDHYIV